MATICVILGRGRHAALIQEWKDAADAGAQLVELRLDCLRRDIDLKRILANRYSPCVVTIRRGRDGGIWRQDEERRQRLLREAIVMGVDYVDIEADIAKEIRRFGKVKRIISYHNFKETPKELPDIIQKMATLDADIVKVATIATSIQDAAFVLKTASEAPVPTIAIAMGEVGFFTRILGAKYGAPLTYASFNPDRSFAPGLPNFRDLKRDYRFEKIDSATEVYGVIGDPVAQSLSPMVHNAIFEHYGQNKVYVPFKVAEGKLPTFFESLDFLKLKGLSVTIPHKEAIRQHLDEEDDIVETTGSCNTVEIRPDGTRVGHNTDYPAVIETLEDALGGRPNPALSPLEGKQALLVGAGGVARSIAYALTRHGAGVTIVARNDEKSKALAEEVGCKFVPWTMRASTLSDILINATPVGMHPEVNETPLPPAAFRENILVFDTVYHPENTLFLKLGREHNCKIATGVEMFVRQAARQARFFAGVENPPLDVIRGLVRRKFSPLQHDVDPELLEARDEPQVTDPDLDAEDQEH
ncbi:shikimate 5-dehydrogenase [Isosphaera pallida ATCC 43644]|uniref:Multifunctional fusion protein n=1 Tax=Isosphaera pallida (strain ATCC 43644 / DSM 9630 / IS1B) TaxID=575540 RepID=E8R0P8_ISOPI|nr:shikimate dehydrogenase [Isosphaera pallida]ADV61233.1 shikimate 5-dehydrogenase [Isosphaera pallida ATCC 43644]